MGFYIFFKPDHIKALVLFCAVGPHHGNNVSTIWCLHSVDWVDIIDCLRPISVCVSLSFDIYIYTYVFNVAISLMVPLNGVLLMPTITLLCPNCTLPVPLLRFALFIDLDTGFHTTNTQMKLYILPWSVCTFSCAITSSRVPIY